MSSGQGQDAVSKIVRACTECGGGLVVRTNRGTGEKFLGCSRYPECVHTEPLPVDQLLRLSGAATLPGMEGL